jgi:uncharacterized protein (TIGR02145 family)
MRSCAAFFLLVFTLTASLPAQDTVHVKAGWNIIGSVKAGAVVDVLTTEPPGIITTTFYGYNPGVGYQSYDTLTKGLGYWVKASADGAIILEVAPPDTVYVVDSAACGVKTVLYDGTIYRTEQIGSQCWLDRNLNVGSMINADTNQADNAMLEKWCYNNDPVNCGVYGGLYQWNEAMQYDTTEGVQGICPPGWHIPTDTEFQTLMTTVGNDGNALKALGQGSGGGSGTNSSGFSALLAGRRNNESGSFSDLGDGAYFWLSTEHDGQFAGGGIYFSGNSQDLILDNHDKNHGFSVRCLED